MLPLVFAMGQERANNQKTVGKFAISNRRMLTNFALIEGNKFCPVRSAPTIFWNNARVTSGRSANA